MRCVYVISDLHLGGKYSDPPAPGKRGFRLCTRPDAVTQFIESLIRKIAQQGPIELVLNGDTVDFLAEQDDVPASWSAFTADPVEAVKKFERIVKRDPGVFDALSRFLDHGGRLVVLLGNHDIELGLPLVRTTFRRAIGVKPGHDFEFLYDGEAYVVGDALIEHGNRYDAWNQVDYDGLRRIRSIQSRHLDVPREYTFAPPPGSEMVVSVINEIKLDYPFVDLLKPETAAVAPMLLALEPAYRNRIARIALLYKRTLSHGLTNSTMPKFGGDIRSDDNRSAIPGADIGGLRNDPVGGFGEDISAVAPVTSGNTELDEALEETLKAALGSDGSNFLRDLDAQVTEINPLDQIGAEIGASDMVSRVFGFAALLLGRTSQSYEKRMPALLKAMRGLQSGDTFDPTIESATEYLDAARNLADCGGFRHVVFGHTHQAKRVDLGDGRLYLNSGTWADVLRFPVEVFNTEADSLHALQSFVSQMKAGDFSAWTMFYPTYVRLDIDDADKVACASLQTFSEGDA